MDKNNEWKLPKDTYYDFDTEAADHKQEEDMKRKQQRTSEFVIFLTLCNSSLPRVLQEKQHDKMDTSNKADPL